MKLSLLFEAVRSTDEAIAILGIQRGYTFEELKKAYKEAAKKTHPDMGGSNEKFIAVNDSFKLLSNRINQDPTPFMSGIHKNTDTKFQTMNDYLSELREKAKTDLRSRNILAHMEREAKREGKSVEELYHMPEETNAKNAGEDGMNATLRFLLAHFNPGKYKLIRPHLIQLEKPIDANKLLEVCLKLYDKYNNVPEPLDYNDKANIPKIRKWSMLENKYEIRLLLGLNGNWNTRDWDKDEYFGININWDDKENTLYVTNEDEDKLKALSSKS